MGITGEITAKATKKVVPLMITMIPEVITAMMIEKEVGMVQVEGKGSPVVNGAVEWVTIEAVGQAVDVTIRKTTDTLVDIPEVTHLDRKLNMALFIPAVQICGVPELGTVHMVGV